MFICVHGKNQLITLPVTDLKLPNEVVAKEIIWRGGFVKSMVLEISQVLLIYTFRPKWFGPTHTIDAEYLCAMSTFTHDEDKSPPS